MALWFEIIYFVQKQANSNDWYPTMKFKVSCKDLFRKTAIIVEMKEKHPRNLQRKSFRAELPLDYWNFIPRDPQQEENFLNPNRRVLSHAQVTQCSLITCFSLHSLFYLIKMSLQSSYVLLFKVVSGL